MYENSSILLYIYTIIGLCKYVDNRNAVFPKIDDLWCFEVCPPPPLVTCASVSSTCHNTARSSRIFEFLNVQQSIIFVKNIWKGIMFGGGEGFMKYTPDTPKTILYVP